MSPKTAIRKLRAAFHDFRCSAIVNTPPLQARESPATILSMVCHRDVIMYLVAAKSFVARLGYGAFVLIDDGSLTQEDRDLFKQHLGGPQIIPISAVSTAGFPRGGTWERLLKIVDMVSDNYVIQLDADTLALGSLEAVKRCVQTNTSFTLGTRNGQAFVPLPDAAKIAQNAPGMHLQDVAERNLEHISGAQSLKYVRGCSGFAGFAKGSASRSQVKEFSQQMAAGLSGRWQEWGSEQVTSNYVVANAPAAMVLPYPAYSGFEPGASTDGLDFLHFIGSTRYAAGTYTQLSRQFIDTLPHS